MATTENLVFGDGGDTYSFSFPYLKIEDVRVELQEFDASQPVGDQIISRLTTQAFTIPVGNPTTIVFDAIGVDTVYQTAPDGDVRVTSTNGYPVRIRIYRFTQADATPSTFFAGSAIRAQDLNDNFDQILYIMQEKENALISIQTGGIGDNVISTSAIQDDAVDANKLRDSVSTDGDRAVTTNHIRDNAITTAKIANDAVTTAKIATNAVTTAKLDSDLTVDLASGTASVPSLTFDADTGLYSPGADQVAISTNGAQRINIEADGDINIDSGGVFYDATNNRLAIGTTSPSGILHLNTAGTTRFFIEGNDGISEIRANNGNLSLFTNQGADANGANNTIFYRNGSNESIRIDSSGRLLVGTSSASGNAKLQVAGDITATGDATVGSLNGGQLAGFRNVLINGKVSINQRNVTYAAAAVGDYWADRWKKTAGGMTQIVEDGNYQPSTQYTLSGTGVTTQQITSPASGNWTIPTVPATATNIQLEPGPVATPFEHRPIGTELALCQRYYETGSAVLAGYSQTGVANGITVFWKQTKRAAPTLTYTPTGTANVSVYDIRNPTIDRAEWYAEVTANGGFIWSGTYTASAEL